VKSYIVAARWLLTAIVMTTPYSVMSAQAPANGSNRYTVIDGSKTPALIPDSVAYRFVLLSLAVPLAPTKLDLLKQEARLKRIDLSALDKEVLLDALKAFSRDYNTWKDKSNAASGPDPAVQPMSSYRASLAAERDSLIENHVTVINQVLSEKGREQFKSYVTGEKTKMTFAQ
jgi:hypothetical protein